MTAAQLLRALESAGCRPEADGGDLVLAADPPASLTSALAVIHTGVRAALTGGGPGCRRTGKPSCSTHEAGSRPG